MDDPDSLHEFWRGDAPEGNEPEAYLAPVHRSKALAGLISHLPKDAEILEVGCNVGRNLAYLHDQGWTRVTGVEISPRAVELLRREYPQLGSREIHLGAAEEQLPRFGDRQFDLVFTMAVLEHIHPQSAAVFDHVARIGRSVLAIEPEANASHRQYPHDVEALFTSRGLRLASKVSVDSLPEMADDPALNNYFAWLFER